VPTEIEKFLRETEKYLERLMEKVSQAKMTESSDDVYQVRGVLGCA
jgi:hypothetical protein